MKIYKTLLRNYENIESGCIVIDDMLVYKPWSQVNDVVCWDYDHVSQKMQKRILMLDFYYTDDTGVSIPLGYEIITKSESVWSAKYQKYVKKALFTKKRNNAGQTSYSSSQQSGKIQIYFI